MQILDENLVKKMIEDALDKREKVNSLSPSLIPYHAHTGVDSPRVDGSNIVNLIPPRIASTTTSGTPAPNASSTDLFELTAQTVTAAFQIVLGTPVNGQKMSIRVTSSATGTPRPLTWSSSTGGYIGNSPSLPSTTTTGKTTTLGFEYDTASSVNKWRLIYSANS